MYALCVSGAVNMQGFVWKFFIHHINFHSFIQYICKSLFVAAHLVMCTTGERKYLTLHSSA